MRHFGFGRAMAVGVDADGVSFQQEEGVVEFLERGAVADADEGDPGGLNATPSPWRSLCARGPAGFAAPHAVTVAVLSSANLILVASLRCLMPCHFGTLGSQRAPFGVGVHRRRRNRFPFLI